GIHRKPGICRRFDDTGETVRPRAHNVNIHDLADQNLWALPMHGLEIGCTPGDLSWFPPLPLEQHLELTPDGRRIEGLRFLIEQALQDMQALPRDPVRHLVW